MTSNEQGLNELSEAVDRLQKLLAQPEPGLITWWECLEKAVSGVDEAWSESRRERIKVGDTMRISAALLKELYEQPEHTSIEVRVETIRTMPEGYKMLWLATVPPGGNKS